MGKFSLREMKARRSATDFLSSILKASSLAGSGERNRRKKSVTDTDSGMQQEHSRRKSMFSSSDGEEGGTSCDSRLSSSIFS